MDNIINYYYMTSITGQPGGGDVQTGYVILFILSALVIISLAIVVFMMVRDMRPRPRYPRPRYPRPRKHHRSKK